MRKKWENITSNWNNNQFWLQSMVGSSIRTYCLVQKLACSYINICFLVQSNWNNCCIWVDFYPVIFRFKRNVFQNFICRSHWFLLKPIVNSPFKGLPWSLSMSTFSSGRSLVDENKPEGSHLKLRINSYHFIK